jgi:pimeloyl-ACP methyl ester carboxylesterase
MPKDISSFALYQGQVMKNRSYCFLCIIGFLIFAGCARGNHVVTQPVATIPVHKAQVDGVELGYRMAGEGAPLLMIVGYACTMDSWDPQLIAELSRNHRVIMFDNRGAGHSTIDDTELTISRMARDAVGLLDALHIEQTDVLGWSMGSIIAQKMLLAHPHRVNKAVLLATAVDAEPVIKSLNAMATLGKEEFVNRLFPQAWMDLHPDCCSRLPRAAAVSNDVITRQYEALAKWKGSATELGNIDTEVLIVAGEEDRVTPIDQSLAAANHIPGAWLVRFRPADHWVMYQAPEQIAKTVDFFLTAEQRLVQPRDGHDQSARTGDNGK